MKKTVSILMSIALIICIGSTSLVSFAGSTVNVTREIERKSITLAQAQNSIEIDVKITDIDEGEGFTNHNFTFDYDARLQVRNITEYDAAEVSDLSEDLGKPCIISSGSFTEPFTEETLLFKIAFTLPADAAVGDKYEIRFDDNVSTQLKLNDENILPDTATNNGYIEILPDNKFAVTTPQANPAYTVAPVEGYQSPVEPGADYKFTVSINDGYHKGDAFAVKSNSETLTPDNGVYTVSDIREHKNITVKGVFSHNFDDDYCTDSENHWLECSCGEQSELGTHTFGAKTSNNDDTHTCTCSVCQYSKTDDCQYTAVVTPATGESKGFTTYTCADCGYSYTEDEPDSCSHTYGGWQLDGDMLLSKTCLDCGEKLGFVKYLWNEFAKLINACWARAIVPILALIFKN